MKPPAFQFYASDFLAGTIELSAEQVGAYIRLLCYQWDKGQIPADKPLLDRVAGCSVCETVLAKFPDGKNPRMEQVRADQAEFRALKSNAGKIGADKRWHSHASAMRLPMANGMANGMANDSSPSPSPTPIDAQTDRGMPTLTEVKAYASMHGVKPDDAEQFWHHFESAGWVDKNGNQIKRWQSKLMTWKTNAAASVGGFDSKKRQPFVSELKAVLEAKRTLRDKIKNRGHENALGWTAANEEDRKQFAALNREIGDLIEKIARATV